MLRKGLKTIFLAACLAACSPGGRPAPENNHLSPEAPPTEMTTDLVTTAQDGTTVVTQVPKKIDLIFGDSNAQAMKTYNKLTGDTKSGRTPKEVLAALRAWPREDLKGKTILLTLGTGNAPDLAEQYVPQILDYVRDSSPANVIVMGISEKHTKTDGLKMNVWIESHLKKYDGFIYGGPIKETIPDNIHAASPVKLLRQATDSLNTPRPFNLR